MSDKGTEVIPLDKKSEGETDEDYYVRYYADAVVAPYKGTRKMYAPTGGGSRAAATTASTKQPAIMSVTANKGQTEGFSLKNPISGEVLIPGDKPQSYHEYSFPDVVAEVNLAPFVNEEVKAQAEGKLGYDIQGLRFNQNGDIILPDVYIDAIKVGDVTISKNSSIYSQIGASLQEDYNYDITQWANGSVYGIIQGQASGAPQTPQPGAAPAIKFNAIVQ